MHQASIAAAAPLGVAAAAVVAAVAMRGSIQRCGAVVAAAKPGLVCYF